MQNKKTGEVRPIWFTGIDGTKYVATLDDNVDNISWRDVPEWEKVKKVNLKGGVKLYDI